MVTASHNPTGDNGVKIIEPTGHMLENDWEHLATELVNANDTEFEELASSTEKSIMEKAGLKTKTIPENSKIFIGSDTRDSSPWLMRAVARGAEFGRVLKVNEFGRRLKVGCMEKLIFSEFYDTTVALHCLCYEQAKSFF